MGKKDIRWRCTIVKKRKANNFVIALGLATSRSLEHSWVHKRNRFLYHFPTFVFSFSRSSDFNILDGKIVLKDFV